MDIATWNVNSLRVRLDHLVNWLQTAQPDVVCLQETKVTDDKFPQEPIAAAGYAHQAIYGQKTYNGVAILSKHPLEGVQCGFTVKNQDDPQTRLIRATVQGVDIWCCYVPNGNQIGSPKFRYKLDWLRSLRAELAEKADASGPVVVCGDFNIAPQDIDVFDPFAQDGEILFHPLEHRALKKITGWGLKDALRVVHPNQTAFTWWDYRAGAFRKNFGCRIDLHLISQSLAEVCTDVVTWREVRSWEQPSDHVPVVVKLER